MEEEEVAKGDEEGFIARASRFDKLLVLMCTSACCIAIYSSEYIKISLIFVYEELKTRIDNSFV